jgi:hypothetical protein
VTGRRPVGIIGNAVRKCQTEENGEVMKQRGKEVTMKRKRVWAGFRAGQAGAQQCCART